MNELRCESTMHGRFVDETHLEVKCWRRRCGYKKGVVVLHVFDITTGEYTTQRFADPRHMEERNHDTRQNPAVRSA